MVNRLTSMVQIKVFSETTYSSKNAGPNAFTIDDLQQKINDFLSERKDEIIVKDIKYSIQCPNPNNSVKVWTVMVIYETR